MATIRRDEPQTWKHAGTGLIRGAPRDKPGSYEIGVSAATATETTRGKLRIELGADEPPP